MYCNECGKKINVGEKFCGKCGAMTKDTDVNINTTAKNPITRPDVNNILKKQSISFNIPQKKQLFLLIKDFSSAANWKFFPMSNRYQ